MYVAITRARKRLYISHSQTRMLHGQTRYNMRSRFFDELPEGCLRWITPKANGFSRQGGLGSAFGGGFGGGRSPQSWAQENPVLEAYKSYPSSGRSDIYRNFQARDAAPVAVVPTLQPKAGRGTDLVAGNKVFHNKFGEGKVLTVEGQGADARAQINFPRHGVKWLALGVAKLTLVED